MILIGSIAKLKNIIDRNYYNKVRTELEMLNGICSESLREEVKLNRFKKRFNLSTKLLYQIGYRDAKKEATEIYYTMNKINKRLIESKKIRI